MIRPTSSWWARARPAPPPPSRWPGRPRSSLVDKATFPRDKFCGDGLTTGALRLLEELGLDPAAVAVVAARSTTSWSASPSGREVTLPAPPRPGHASPPSPAATDLDAALLDVARARRASRCTTGTRCTGAPSDGDDGVVARGRRHRRRSRARYVVAADGMWSPLRKLLGAGRRRATWASGTPSASTSPTSARGRAELFVWFEPDLLPGYAWSFPLPDGGANVGFGIQRGGTVARSRT